MKYARLVTMILLTVILGFGASDLFAQAWSGPARIKGIVKDAETGEPIKGAEVSLGLINERETGPPALITDKKGRFSKLGLKGNMWWVTVKADGYEPWAGPHEIFSHSAPETLVVKLKRLPEEVIRAEKQFKAQERLDRAKELAAEGNLEGAREEYRKALDELEEVDHPVVLAVLASTYMQEGNIDEAKKILEQSLAINPDHPASLKALCAIVASQGDLEHAEALFEKIPEDEIVHPNTTMNLGMAHYNKGEMDQAKQYLDRTIRDHPDVALAYYFRGLIDLSLDPASATADFKKYVELSPDSKQANEAREYLKYLEAQPAGE